MRRPTDLTRRLKAHPDGYSLNVCMKFEGMEAAGWVQKELHLLADGKGHTIRAEFGRVDGFACWRYVTGAPGGKTFGAFASAAGAAAWIARSTAHA